MYHREGSLLPGKVVSSRGPGQAGGKSWMEEDEGGWLPDAVKSQVLLNYFGGTVLIYSSAWNSVESGKN